MSTATTTPHAGGAGSAAASAASASAAVAANGDVSNLFTTLLVAQLRNQDPLSPTDPSEFVGQLTQLSQMEALQKLTAQGEINAGLLASLQLMTLGAQVGSQVQVRTSRLEVGDEPLALRVALDAAAADASLVLTGADGSIQRVPLGSLTVGEHAYTLDPAQLGLRAGSYAVRVESDGSPVGSVELQGLLSGVRLGGDGSAQLQVQGAGEVGTQAVTQFKGRQA